MARPAVEIDDEFLEKLHERDRAGALLSRIENVMTEAEKERLKDDGKKLQEKAEKALDLLTKFNKALPLIEDEEVKQKTILLAQEAKEMFVKYVVQAFIREPDPEVEDIFLLTVLLFDQQADCLDIGNFSEQLDSEAIVVGDQKKIDCRNKFESIKADFQNNHNQR